MSNVPEYKRKKSTCEAIIKARHLATYTIQICANSKVFLPEYNSSLTDEIVHDAKEAYILAWEAHAKKGNTYHVRARMRRFYDELWSGNVL